MPKIKLTQLQKEILSFIGKNSFGKNFYWTGGTLLSYFYLSHRFSVDLDFFSHDLYWYLANKPKYNLQKLIDFIEKKIGITIQPSLLIEKIYQLCDDLDKLKPLLTNYDKNISRKAKDFFQDEFNKLARKKIK